MRDVKREGDGKRGRERVKSNEKQKCYLLLQKSSFHVYINEREQEEAKKKE